MDMPIILKNNFLKIYDGKRPYYGGAQKWFNCDDLKKAGCSIVAAANITAYYAITIKNKNIYNYEDMSKSNFLNHMESIAKYIYPDPSKGVISIIYFNDRWGERRIFTLEDFYKFSSFGALSYFDTKI